MCSNCWFSTPTPESKLGSLGRRLGFPGGQQPSTSWICCQCGNESNPISTGTCIGLDFHAPDKFICDGCSRRSMHYCCLTCDRETTGGEAFCSQSCRLADVQTGTITGSLFTSPSALIWWPSGHGAFLLGEHTVLYCTVSYHSNSFFPTFFSPKKIRDGLNPWVCM